MSKIMIRINLPDPSNHYYEHYWKHVDSVDAALLEFKRAMENGVAMLLPRWEDSEPAVIGPDLLRKCTVTAWDAERPDSLPITDKSFDPEHRWANGFNHHPLSEELMKHCQDVDNAHDDYFDWRTGGDGDNGEVMLHLMDTWFEKRDREKA